MSDLSTAVCSITTTQRRRYFWAAWWTGAPSHTPFRKPDAANGGCKSRDEALAEAERVAGRHLVLVEPYWAHAWNRILRGEKPAPPPASRPPKPPRAPAPKSAWEVLGLAPGAALADVKRAFRRHALETHPDRGGEAARFREVQRAYERLSAKLTAHPRTRRRDG